MELLPATLAAPAVFDSSPFPLAHDREAGAVDNQMDGALDWEPLELHIEPLTPPRERGVIRCVEVTVQQGQNRPQEPLRLAQRQSEDEAERQRGLDRQIREPALPARPTGWRRFPRIRGVGR